MLTGVSGSGVRAGEQEVPDDHVVGRLDAEEERGQEVRVLRPGVHVHVDRDQEEDRLEVILEMKETKTI